MSAAPAVLAEMLARPDFQAQVRRGDQFAVSPAPTLPSGFAALDAELPGGGWPRGVLCEILLDGQGFGELSLLMPALRELRSRGDWILAIAPPHPLHAPAWQAAGVGLEHLVIVAPQDVGGQNALWAAEQALNSRAPQAVLCWSRVADGRAVRRLQVAAGQGSAVVFLFRPAARAREASPAALRMTLSSAPRGGLAVRLLKRRGPPALHDIVLPLSFSADPNRHVASRSPSPLAPVAGPASARDRLCRA